MQNIINLMLKIGEVTLKLNELLGITFIEGQKSMESCIGKSLKNVVLFNNKGEHNKSEFEISKLLFLIYHLEILKNNKIGLFNYYKSVLLSDIGNYDKYFGKRFEISIAACLISNDVNVNKAEPPLADFFVNEYNIYIECSSRHLNRLKNYSNPIGKLSKVIDEKSKQEYCNYSTALFLDCTSLYHYLLNRDVSLTRDLLAEELAHSMRVSKFGSFIFFFYAHDLDDNSFGQKYMRIDNNSPEEKLKCFLDKNFPMGELAMNNFGISNNV